jgi:hypothetical protein
MRGLSRLRRIASRAKRRAKHILGIDPLRLDRAHFVTDASGIEIPEESSLRRTPPRAPELRQFAYMSQPAPVTFRHFRAITTDWHGNSRGVLYPPDPAEHTIDQVWIDQMRRIGWSD